MATAMDKYNDMMGNVSKTDERHNKALRAGLQTVVAEGRIAAAKVDMVAAVTGRAIIRADELVRLVDGIGDTNPRSADIGNQLLTAGVRRFGRIISDMYDPLAGM